MGKSDKADFEKSKINKNTKLSFARIRNLVSLKSFVGNFKTTALIGLIFGVAAVIGAALTLAFQEPTAGPGAFREPVNTRDKGDYLAYGRGWAATSSGDGSVALTKATCDSASSSNWYWFEDGNGDGDSRDQEDGTCVLATTTLAASWNGYDWSTNYDNTYIADYTCSGSFPTGTVASYSGVSNTGAADTTWNAGDCALCQADCYDGRKDLPGQNGYTSSPGGTTGYSGPLTPEILKNWRGTRLPTANDFFSFCGATSGDADATAGDSLYHASGASASTTLGNYGGNVGRGRNSSPHDKYLDLSNTAYEWLSEQLFNVSARIAGSFACSYSGNNGVYSDFRFRAAFRP